MGEQIFIDGVKVYDGPIRPSAYQIDQKKKKEESGRAAWKVLHLAGLAGTIMDDWLTYTWQADIPKYGCSCLTKFQALRKQIPFRPDDQFGWTVDIHNAVNVDMESRGDKGKRQWTTDEARRAWEKIKDLSA
jgi:hypothetical protein